MKTFISYRHTGASKVFLEPLLATAREALEAHGVEVYCTFFEQHELELQCFTPKQYLRRAFGELNTSDLMLVIQSSEQRSEGMLVEVGYCLAKGVPVVVATKEGVQRTYLPELAQTSFYWNSLEDLTAKIQELEIMSSIAI